MDEQRKRIYSYRQAILGTSTATDVRLKFDPEVHTALGEMVGHLVDTPLIASGIPNLPPGRELRTAFEVLRERRSRPGLPGRYQVIVSYKGGSEELSSTHVLDLELFEAIIHARTTAAR